ncbi:tandem-95 repeat protein [bacterium]|nr:MAG: tandem-95 repeat protein [bacterium]
MFQTRFSKSKRVLPMLGLSAFAALGYSVGYQRDEVSSPTSNDQGAAPVMLASLEPANIDHSSHEDPSKNAANWALFRKRIAPVAGAKKGSYEEVSRIISRSDFEALPQATRGVIRDLLMDARAGHPGRQFCFAPGTKPTRVQNTLNAVTQALDPGAIHAAARWTGTATNPSIARNQPFTLTWNIMPDGAPMGNDKSGLIAWGIKNFGSEEKMRAAYRAMFARWSELTSITYVEVDYDDEQPGEPGGELGVRADIRIGGRDLSSTPGVLAVNAFPNGGEMTMGTNWTYNADFMSDNGFFNVTGHEHGHGIGLAHGCPQNGTKLMEPALNGGFRGPQLDDWLGAQFNYGDQYEKGTRNNSPASGTNLGTMALNSETILKEVSLNLGDIDVYKITPDTDQRSVTAVLKPFGATYLDGEQGEDGCAEGTPFLVASQRDLNLEIVNGAGTILASSAATPAGGTETITSFDLTGSGPYYARVISPDRTDKIQPYTLSLKIGPRTNRAPEIRNLRFEPKRPNTNSNLKLLFDLVDPDPNDVPSASTVWTKNGSPMGTPANNTYNLAPDGNGDDGDVFEVTVNARDDKGSTATATIRVVVRPANVKPVFPDSNFTVLENKVLTNKLKATDANSADVNAVETLSFKTVTRPQNGTVIISTDGTFIYTPKANYNGPDSFKARVSDQEGLFADSTVNITVTSVNNPPVLQDDIIKAQEDTPLTIAAETLFKNDTNGEIKGEADPIKIVAVKALVVPFPGKLTLDQKTQNIYFTPSLNWNGETSFSYTVEDSAKNRSTAKVTLQVAAVNDAPTAQNLSVQTVAGTPLEFEVFGSDPEGQLASFTLKDKPKNGKASISLRDGKWYVLYKPAKDFVGEDTLTYSARDGFLTSVPATVKIKVTKNTAPKIVGLAPKSGTFAPGSTVVFTQQVRDTNGVGHIDAVSLLISNSNSKADDKGAAALWFDAVNNVFTMSTDDGSSTYTPLALGKKLYNSQVSIELRPEDVVRGKDGTLTLKWRVTFKEGFVGTKTLWSFVQDLGGLSAGYAAHGNIVIGSATQSSTKSQ